MSDRVESKQIEKIPITADDRALMVGVNALGMYGGAREMMQDAVEKLGKQIDDPNNRQALMDILDAVEDALKAIGQWQRVTGE